MDEARLDEALELGSLVLPAAPGHIELLDLAGMVARSTSVPSPFTNLAGRLRLSAENADAALYSLRAHFETRKSPFGVMIGPRSTPLDWPARLERHGLRHAQRCEGLVLTDLGIDVPHDASVVVERIDVARRAAFDRVKAAAFGMPLAVAEGIGNLLFGSVSDRIVFHLAYVAGEPVGFAQTFYHHDVAILGGAGVIPAARGKGAFRALLAHRFALARQHGMRAATIQAYDNTSAPILRRLGFTSRGDLHLWTWSPEA